MSKQRWTLLDVPEIEQWKVGVLLAEVDGAEEIVGLKLEPRGDGDALRQSKIGATSIRKLPMRAINAALVRRRTEALDVEWMDLDLTRHAYPPDFYATVASMYRTAVEEDLPPGPFISGLTGASASAVAKWVGKARKLGLLGAPLRPGVAGEASDGEAEG